MSKPKLGIDIDEVLRAKWLAFDRYYADEFGEQGIKEPFDTYDLMNHYEFKDTEVVEDFLNEKFLEDENMQKVSPTEYVVNQETGKAGVDDFAFNTEKTMLTAQQVFEKFLYEDFVFEIHGSAPKLYMNADVDMTTFIKLFEKYFDIYFYAKTRKVAIPATLFFLSKMRVEAKNIFIAYDDQEVWDKFDWVLTTDPNILNKKPEGKTTVKLTRIYNADSTADYIEDYGIGGLIAATEEDATKNVFRDYVVNKLNLNAQ